MTETVVQNALGRLANALAIQVEFERLPFYEEALKPYSEAELNRAVKSLSSSWKYTRFPNPGHIIDAIGETTYAKPTVPVGDFRETIRLAEERARTKAKDFVQRFGQSGLAQKAKSEGWQDKLKEHVYAVAEYHFFKHEKKLGNVNSFGCGIYPTVNCMGELVDKIRERQGISLDPVVELDSRLIEAWKKAA